MGKLCFGRKVNKTCSRCPAWKIFNTGSSSLAKSKECGKYWWDAPGHLNNGWSYCPCPWGLLRPTRITYLGFGGGGVLFFLYRAEWRGWSSREPGLAGMALLGRSTFQPCQGGEGFHKLGGRWWSLKESFCLWDRGIMDFWEAVFIICKTVHRKQWGLGTELPVNESFVFLLSIHILKLLVEF